MAFDFNQSLFYSELKRRRVRIKPIAHTPFSLGIRKKQKELLYDVSTSSTTFPAGWIASDKTLTKLLLSHAHIPVPEGHFFTFQNTEDALKFAKSIGFPVVLKPTTGTHGDWVFSCVETEKELAEKIALFERENVGNGYYLVEKHIFGEEYRIFATRKGYIAAVHRTPAEIIGDGKNTILGLIQIENYKRMNPRTTCLCEIKLDAIFFDTLEKNEKTLDQVPLLNEKIRLRPTSNVSMGGDCEACTNRVHPSVKKLVKQIFQAIPGLSVVGIDLLCEDISKPLEKQVHAVCELNTAPGLSLHMVPPKGKPDNVASQLADLIFPKE